MSCECPMVRPGKSREEWLSAFDLGVRPSPFLPLFHDSRLQTPVRDAELVSRSDVIGSAEKAGCESNPE